MRRFSLRRWGMGPLSLAAIFCALAFFSSAFAATITQEVSSTELNLGDPVQVTFSIEGGALKQKASSSFFGGFLPNYDVTFPTVQGIDLVGQNSGTMSINGQSKATVAFTLVPSHAGDFTIPAFNIPMQDGSHLTTKAIKLHVLTSDTVVPAPAPTPAPPPANPFAPNGVNPPVPIPPLPHGPVVMPDPNQQPQPQPGQPAPPDASAGFTIPLDKDGTPARVFMVITPETTDAYVGQSIAMKIEWYIRRDVQWQQDSLPTIIGSDFLMNNLSVHPGENISVMAEQAYYTNTWTTAISAPKSGDFSLKMQRDSYWIKGSNDTNLGFGGFFRRPSLAHELIPSNELTIHVHPLPEEGRPANFSGAIGQLDVTGTAEPLSVAVGEPVTLHFTVSGTGNFGYVRCPTLAEDPAWKRYTSSSKVEFQDEARVQGTKTFEQAVIPQKNGTVPLPEATFSYFNPTSKQYVTVPVEFQSVTVSGALPSRAAAAPVDGDAGQAVVPKQAELFPNRAGFGYLQSSLTPAYRQPWFWATQGGLLAAILASGFFAVQRTRVRPDDGRAERLARESSLKREEDAMAEAVRRKDGLAFFLAARHAVQLQLGAQWGVSPEALTLGEIEQRDPALAASLEPLFHQADEVIYSGGTGGPLDLAAWESQVRDLLKPQPQPAQT